ncbi:MAG: fibronectin type III domain-containing protein [Acidimicrobiales bacterium]
MSTRSIVITVLAGVSAMAIPAAAMEVAQPARPRVVKAGAAGPAPSARPAKFTGTVAPKVEVAAPAAAPAPPATEAPKPVVATALKPVTTTAPKPDEAVRKLPLPPQPVRLVCEPGLPDGAPAVRCTWSPLDGAVHYVLFRLTGDVKERISTGTDTSFVDRSVARGMVYAYGVKALDAGGQIIGVSDVVRLYCCGAPMPEKQHLRLACEAGLSGNVPTVRCRWSAADRADHYVLFRKTADGTLERIFTGTDTAFVDLGVIPGMEYGYGVKAVGAAGRVIGASDIVRLSCCGGAG